MQLEPTAGHCKMPLTYPELAGGPRVNKFQAVINKDKLSATLSLPPPPEQRYLTAQYSLTLIRQRRATSAVSGVTCHNSNSKCSLAASHLTTDCLILSGL